MRKPSVVRAVIALLIAVVLGGAYAIVVRNQANSAGGDAASGFFH
jgi:hypothetical protein